MSLLILNKLFFLMTISLVLSQMSCDLPPEPDLPAPPTNPPYWLTIESLSENKLKLSWVVWYSHPVIVHRSDSVHPFSIVASQVTSNYFIDSTVTNNATYSYRLQGISGGDTSYFSETIVVKYLPTNKIVQKIQSNRGIGATTLSDNGSLIGTIEDGIVIRNYNDLSQSVKIENWYESWFPRVAIGFSSTSSMITSGLVTIKTFNTVTGSEVLNINTDTSFIKRLFFVDNDKRIVGVFQTIKREGPYGWIAVWDAKTGSILQRFDSLFLINASAVVMSPNRKIILVGIQNKMYKFTINTSLEHSITSLDAGFTSITFSNDGEYFIGNRWGQVSFYNTNSGEKTRTLYGDYIAAYYLSLNPSGNLLLASDLVDDEVRIYDLSHNVLERVINVTGNSGGQVSGLQFSNDGQSFIVTSTDGKIIKYSTTEFLYSWQKIK